MFGGKTAIRRTQLERRAQPLAHPPARLSFRASGPGGQNRFVMLMRPRT
jgi:hypothetical protein